MVDQFPTSQSPRVARRTEQGRLLLELSGTWATHTLHMVEGDFRAALRGATGPVTIDLGALAGLDTAGALLLNQGKAALDLAGKPTVFSGLDERRSHLLNTSHLPEPEDAPSSDPRASFPVRFVANTGKRVLDELHMGGQLLGFLGHYLTFLARTLLNPARLRVTSLVFHMEQTGLRAVPIVALLTFLIGMVVAYMGAEELAKFGAQVFAVNLLEVTIMREMGVLITAIVVAGRSSSSFTAQIGAMVANEEVAAMRSMGLDPMDLLVVPRVLALMLTLPMLVFLADLAALLGGAVAIWYSMDLGFGAFITQFHNVAQLKNFLVGMVKTPVFALIIGVVGCFQGFRATSSAASVGFLTTVAVVEAIFIVILVDALFAIFFTTIGI